MVAFVLATAVGYSAQEDRAPKSMDGSTFITCGTSTFLFNGAVPPNGFMVQATTGYAIVNDNGPAVFGGSTNDQGGFYLVNGQVFVTPPGYKPLGPIRVICPPGDGTPYVAARAW